MPCMDYGHWDRNENESVHEFIKLARHTFTSTLKPAIKKEWLAALRSGEIDQCRHTLCDDKGAMCCLGVLHDTQGDHWYFYDNGCDDLCYLSIPPEKHEEINNLKANGRTMLTEEALKDAGLSIQDAYFLARMNDTRYSFKEIAQVIEDYL